MTPKEQIERFMRGELSEEGFRRRGERHEAQEHLTTAVSMYREMDMRFWLEQAQAVAA